EIVGELVVQLHGLARSLVHLPEQVRAPRIAEPQDPKGGLFGVEHVALAAQAPGVSAVEPQGPALARDPVSALHDSVLGPALLAAVLANISVAASHEVREQRVALRLGDPPLVGPSDLGALDACAWLRGPLLWLREPHRLNF